MEVISRYWLAFATALGDFVEEAAWRAGLAWAVLTGKVPIERKRRFWNRSVEAPILMDCLDWEDSRLLFSILVWPPLESPAHRAHRDQEARAQEVKEAFGRVCTDRAWSMYFETDYGLRWDHERGVWVSQSDEAIDGSRFYIHSRNGS